MAAEPEGDALEHEDAAHRSRELQAIQTKYKNDPEKLQRGDDARLQGARHEPVQLLSGCLPMLLPMPVLFALFFVFQNTIEFRGVPFLWLPDISLKDPFYILPLLMGMSMFVLSWIGRSECAAESADEDDAVLLCRR